MFDLHINCLLNEVFACFTDKDVHFLLDHALYVLLDVLTNFSFYQFFHLLHYLAINGTHNLMVNSVLDLFIDHNLETLDQVVLDRRRNLNSNEIIELTINFNPDLVAINHDYFYELIMDAKFVLFKLLSDFVIKMTSFFVYLNLYSVAHIIFQGLKFHIDGFFDRIIQSLADL